MSQNEEKYYTFFVHKEAAATIKNLPLEQSRDFYEKGYELFMK